MHRSGQATPSAPASSASPAPDVLPANEVPHPAGAALESAPERAWELPDDSAERDGVDVTPPPASPRPGLGRDTSRGASAYASPLTGHGGERARRFLMTVLLVATGSRRAVAPGSTRDVRAVATGSPATFEDLRSALRGQTETLVLR